MVVERSRTVRDLILGKGIKSENGKEVGEYLTVYEGPISSE